MYVVLLFWPPLQPLLVDVFLCCIIYLKYGSLLIILFEEVLGAAVASLRSNINFMPDILMIFLFMCIFLYIPPVFYSR